MAGADGNTEGIKNIENAVFVYDIEYRNKEILKRIEKIIDKNLQVCLIPREYSSRGKDINELILSGMKKEEIENIINDNIYKGLSAKLKLAELRRC